MTESGYYGARKHKRVLSKYAVALRAVSLLEEGDSLLIDAGTSLTPIAKIIRKRAEPETATETHYTIMTHNNEAFMALSDTPPAARFNVFQTGGRYDRDLNASFGHQAEMAYLGFHPRWVFIGQNGMEADLGLFCHGNTEELALKKEIFAMPASGRVVIADFTKIGTPGGLLFGDSSNLTANVEECWIMTDDLHETKFEDYLNRDSGKLLRDRFETQVRSLKETYEARVESVHFVVSRLAEGRGTWDVLVEKPEREIEEWVTSRPSEIGKAALRYRIDLADKDITSDEFARFQSSKLSRGHVVLSITNKDDGLDVEVVDVGFSRDLVHGYR